MTQAIAAAMLTTGTHHAPLELTVELLGMSDPAKSARGILGLEGRVPGWGSSFIKHGPDRNLSECDSLVEEIDARLYDKISAVSQELWNHNRIIWPNIACYTACYAIINNVPPQLSSFLFVQFRVTAWYKVLRDRVAL